MTYEEMRAKRAELLEKADKALHELDPWGTNAGAIRARKYGEQADELLKQMCVVKGIDWREIF